MQADQSDCNFFSLTIAFVFRMALTIRALPTKHGSPGGLGPANLEATGLWQFCRLNNVILRYFDWYIFEMQ